MFLEEIRMLTKITEHDIFNCLLKLAKFEYKYKATCNYLILHNKKESDRLRNRICNVFEQIAVLLSSTTMDQGNWNGLITY
jgi:hypothetical protein